MLLTIASAIVYLFLVLCLIGAAYSIRDLWRDWRDTCRDARALNQRMCAREMRKRIGLR